VILDPRVETPARIYRFMIDVIVPRPIAFVTTINAAGRPNAAPFSFFNGLSGDPPLLGISINERGGAPKDTLRNIRETGEFVVNVVNGEMIQRVVHASGEWPENVDELALTGLTPAPAERVRPPRVAESPVHLECRLFREVELVHTVFVVGEIVLAHVRDDVVREGQVDPQALDAVGRLGGARYAPVRDIFEIPRPRVERAPK
jgi:flavin reductase (DIM6/NTAB) family NADH-FMN oxidoreductase RutF